MASRKDNIDKRFLTPNQHSSLDNRRDNRSVKKFGNDIKIGNAQEDQAMTDLNQKLNKVLGREAFAAERLGDSELDVGNYKDGGDFTWRYTDKDGSVYEATIDMKKKGPTSAKGKDFTHDDIFRPKMMNVEKCIMKDWLMLYFNRYRTKNACFGVMNKDDLSNLMNRVLPKNSPYIYGGKEFYEMSDQETKYVREWFQFPSLTQSDIARFVDDFVKKMFKKIV